MAPLSRHVAGVSSRQVPARGTSGNHDVPHPCLRRFPRLLYLGAGMPAAITKDNIIDTLEAIAQLLEMKGELIFKIRAYTNAARAVETYPGDIPSMARAGQLQKIDGIGEAIAAKITELVTTGRLEYFETLKAGFPPGLLDLFQLQGLGAKKIRTLHEKLAVGSIADLEKVLASGQVAELPGFGKKTAANIAAAISAHEKHAGSYLLGSIAGDAERIAEDLRSHPSVTQVCVAGSYRRRKETVHDLDFVAASRKPEEVLEFFVQHEFVESVLAQGPTKCSVRFRSGIAADLRVVTSEQFPFALCYFTGSKEHSIEMRNRALERGWTLNEYRLEVLESDGDSDGNKDGGGKRKKAQPIPAVHEERDLYRALGLDYIEPELREHTREFEAAETHELPALVKLENLRGTFHNHTSASDGRATLEEMAAAAQELGLQYLGIADHSQSSIIAHGQNAQQLAKQRAKIAGLNETFGGDFRLFAGVECDIKRDGQLDFPDDVLASLDYVVASVHASFQLPEAEMTRRIIRAISNPYVTMLGHLTGRLLLMREPYAVNVPAIIDAAAETGTVIELNAQPNRLDMDWRWWPLAKEKGVKCSINPDAHSTDGLGLLWFGVAIARKGWLTRRDVINCLPLSKIETELQRKRARLAR